MDIVHIASELAPIAKVGGLGDVLYGLSKALVEKGHRVRILLPKYDILDEKQLESLQVMKERLIVYENQTAIHNTLWSATLHGLELILVESDHPRKYFQRGQIYGEKDDVDRFLFFCKVATKALKDSPPNVIHLHDWPTAGVSLFLKDQEHPKIIFTIHNLSHQGQCSRFNLERLEVSCDEEELWDPLYDDTLNLLKGAVKYSDAVTTVSPSYAEEILTLDGGCCIERHLEKYQKKITGILNGIDTQYWNPETDPLLALKYTKQTYKQGKKEYKEHVQEYFHFAKDLQQPLVISITRLVEQKGPDLIFHGMEKVVELGGQFVLLGSTSDPEMKALFEPFQTLPNIALCFETDEVLAHLLYAGADMLLMPSIFEPCGLTQMIAMRYGCVPLVRSTGGLKDTVFDSKNGFTFEIPDNKGVGSVIERAFEHFSQNSWEEIIQAGMATDFSWDGPADKYLEIYK